MFEDYEIDLKLSLMWFAVFAAIALGLNSLYFTGNNDRDQLRIVVSDDNPDSGQDIEITVFEGDSPVKASDSSHDSVKFYYSETNSTDKGDYRVLTSVDSSDTSPVVISSANRELDSGLSDEHCFTAAASHSGLESGISTPVCVGGDIP